MALTGDASRFLIPICYRFAIPSKIGVAWTAGPPHAASHGVVGRVKPPCRCTPHSYPNLHRFANKDLTTPDRRQNSSQSQRPLTARLAGSVRYEVGLIWTVRHACPGRPNHRICRGTYPNLRTPSCGHDLGLETLVLLRDRPGPSNAMEQTRVGNKDQYLHPGVAG